MPLDPKTTQRIRAEAAKRGVDPKKALAAAERVRSKPAEKASKETASASDGPAKGEPMQMLIGHLSFVHVRELRERLGLTGPFVDDDLPCGVWQRKHEGGGAAAGGEQ